MKKKKSSNDDNNCCLYRAVFNSDSDTSSSPQLRNYLPFRLLDQVIRRMLCSLLLGALGRHLSLLAYLLARPSARIPAVISELDLVMSVLNIMTTPAMIVSSNFCIPGVTNAHFVAAVTSVLLLEGRSDCPISGSVIDPSDYPLPPHLIRWPQTSL